MTRAWPALAIGLAAILVSACSGHSPIGPGGPGNPVIVTPPPNALPVVDSITVQGTRANEPASFADAGERVPVTARVHDEETPSDQLQYAWTATAGTFTGSGGSVTWVAPASVPQAADVTITLSVTEKYGAGNALEHSVTATAHLSLHDSNREVGDMARQFLLDFSDSNIRDVPYIMRNFSKARCPQPAEVDSETSDVMENRDKRRIVTFRVDAPAVAINFNGVCPFRFKRGDACAVVPVLWDAIEFSTNVRGTTKGNDIVAAAYAAAESRWWLCASDYQSSDAFAKYFK